MKRQFSACQTRRSMYPSIFNNFPVIRTASAKIAVFTYRSPHFCFPCGDAPEAITLNVVWMEREFDAYKLSHCMCPSNYYRFWDRAKYLWKNRHFIITLCIQRPVRGFPSEYRHPLLFGKLEWCGYPMVKTFRRYVYSFDVIHERDGRTDEQTDTAWQQRPRLCIASRDKNRVYARLYCPVQ